MEARLSSRITLPLRRQVPVASVISPSLLRPASRALARPKNTLSLTSTRAKTSLCAPRSTTLALSATTSAAATRLSTALPVPLYHQNGGASRSVATSASGTGYTAAFAFYEALWELGVTHCFVNLGSDHPSLIEAMVKGKEERKGQFPRIITCPNEMVAMSMADGYARFTNQPQCVLVHVDVGTQSLGAAMHNASLGRAPVLVFAGLSPITLDGELRGSRHEFQHWLQDVPEQRAIVRQYCRYDNEARTAVNIKQLVARALQVATSHPRGPAYLCAACEVLESETEPYKLRGVDEGAWDPISEGGLEESATGRIAKALAGAEKPVILTAYAARNHEVPGELVALADRVKGLTVMDSGGSDMSFPADHPAWRGTRFGVDDAITEADVIVILDCDVPYIPTRCRPRSDAAIYHIDVDPLKNDMPLFYLEARERHRADPLVALRQLNARLSEPDVESQLVSAEAEKRGVQRREDYDALITAVDKRALEPVSRNVFGTGHLCHVLKEVCPDDTIWTIEAVTNTVFAYDALRLTQPGQWLNCGGGGLGWSGGAAMGIKLATDRAHGGAGKGRFVVQIVGDGSFLFSAPGSVYWIAKRYNIPVLTVVLNNKGWHAPRRSLLLIHPDGEGSKVSNDDINITIDHPLPDFSGIAKAAAGGDLFAAQVEKADELEHILKEAVRNVLEGRSAVVDCKVESGS